MNTQQHTNVVVSTGFLVRAYNLDNIRKQAAKRALQEQNCKKKITKIKRKHKKTRIKIVKTTDYYLPLPMYAQLYSKSTKESNKNQHVMRLRRAFVWLQLANL